MDEILFKMQGFRAELIVYKNRIIIINNGLAEKENIYTYIHFKELESVLVVPAGKSNGRIEFKTKQNKDCSFEIVKVKAKEKNLFAFEIKSYIDEQIEKYNKENVAVIDEIISFYKLVMDRVITQEEFASKKKHLLGL